MVNAFNYEEEFMGVHGEKQKKYRRTFAQDYRLRSLTQTVKLQKGKLLDIGCGGGLLTESLPYYYPKVNIFGCDVSKTAITYAKKLGSGKVKYAAIAKNKLPYKKGTFDVCICFDVLEHVPNVDFFLKEMRRVLKKNGKAFFIVPCEGEPLTYTWFFQKIGHGQKLTYRYFGHIHPEFTHNYVTNLLIRYGFAIEQKAYSEHIFFQLVFFIIFYLPKWLLRVGFGEKKAKEYTDSGLIRYPKNGGSLLFVRRIWQSIFYFMIYYPMNFETTILRNWAPTAWKLHILVRKNNEI